jgi:hypothetical protein
MTEERKYLDAETLTEQELPHEDVECPSLGGWVLVRGLSRDEALDMGKAQAPAKVGKGRTTTKAGKLGKGEAKAVEARMISIGMVKPPMTEAQVRKWQKNSTAGAEVDKVSATISRLSGMHPDAAKEAYLEQAEDSAEDFPVLPG